MNIDLHRFPLLVLSLSLSVVLRSTSLFSPGIFSNIEALVTSGSGLAGVMIDVL